MGWGGRIDGKNKTGREDSTAKFTGNPVSLLQIDHQ